MFISLTLAAALFSSEFEAWMAKHSKSYESIEAKTKAFATYKANEARVAKLNANDKSARFALNRFADITPEEFRARYNGFRGDVKKARLASPTAQIPSEAPPASFDWRSKPGVLAPVQDQGQCGSCWAFSATCNMESRIALKTNQKVNKLAEQALVDCEHVCGQYRFENACDQGCGGGLMPNAFKFGNTKGLPTSASYPYTATDGSCQSYTAAGKVSSWEFVGDVGKEDAIKAYLAANGPVSIAVDASNWQFYDGGVVTAGSDTCATQDPSSPSLDHGVVIVGYTPTYWIVRNSWASSWGNDGYVYLAYGTNTCGIALFACSSIA